MRIPDNCRNAVYFTENIPENVQNMLRYIANIGRREGLVCRGPLKKTSLPAEHVSQMNRRGRRSGAARAAQRDGRGSLLAVRPTLFLLSQSGEALLSIERALYSL